MCYNIGKAFSF